MPPRGVVDLTSHGGHFIKHLKDTFEKDKAKEKNDAVSKVKSKGKSKAATKINFGPAHPSFTKALEAGQSCTKCPPRL